MTAHDDDHSGPKLTPGQVAALFGVEPHTVRRWSNENRIKYTKTAGGARRYDAAYIHRMIQNSTQ
jgi:excisionase family DNA binding protein